MIGGLVPQASKVGYATERQDVVAAGDDDVLEPAVRAVGLDDVLDRVGDGVRAERAILMGVPLEVVGLDAGVAGEVDDRAAVQCGERPESGHELAGGHRRRRRGRRDIRKPRGVGDVQRRGRGGADSREQRRRRLAQVHAGAGAGQGTSRDRERHRAR